MKNLMITDWVILHSLYEQGYVSRLSAARIADIDVDKKPNALYKRLMILSKAGFVCKGMSDGYSHTYYITPEGIKFSEDDNQIDEEDQEKEAFEEGEQTD